MLIIHVISFFLFLIISRSTRLYFMDSKSSSGQDVLVIHNNVRDSMKMIMILMIYKEVSDRNMAPLPKLTTTHPMKIWSILVDFNSPRSKKGQILLDSTHRSLNCFDQLPSLGHRMIDGKIQQGSTLKFLGKFRYIEKYWEQTEDVLSRCECLKAIGIYDALYASFFTYNRNSNIIQAFCEAWCPCRSTLLTIADEVFILL